MSKKLFPGYRYGPEGECELFQSAADVPEGWHRNTPEGLAKLDKAAPEGEDEDDDEDENVDLNKMTKDELIELAEQRGIDLDNLQGSGNNGVLLVGDLREALKEA